MWLRRVPQRTREQGNTAFGSGCKRFDPKVMIIDWALEPPGAGGPDGAGGWRALAVAPRRQRAEAEATVTATAVRTTAAAAIKLVLVSLPR